MTIVASPPEDPQADAAQLLFREARQRRRRRWLIAGIAVAGFVLVAIAAGFVANGGGEHHPGPTFKPESNPAQCRSEPLGSAGHDRGGVVRLRTTPHGKSEPGF